MEEITVLQNQLVIMKALRDLLNLNGGRHENIVKLNNQINFTEIRIKNLV